MLNELFNIEKVFGFCEKVCFFLIVNVLFFISCMPVLLFFLFVGISQVRTYLPLFLFCMLSVPPAFCAVLYAMKHMINGIERGAVKDYIRGYKTDFFQKLRLGFCHLLVIFILWNSIEFYTKQFAVLPLAIIFTLLFVFSIIITPNMYMLAAGYEMSNAAIAKSACILTITKPVYTLGTAAAFCLMLAAFEVLAGTAVLFMVSIYGFLIVFMTSGMFRELENN